MDETGKVLDTAVVYPTFGERQKNEAIDALKKLIAKHAVEHIAIGNGTASRETEQMTCELIAKTSGVSYMIVMRRALPFIPLLNWRRRNFPSMT